MLHGPFISNFYFPRIRQVWPGGAPQYPLHIQQDNAPAHILPNDEDFVSIAGDEGFDLRIRNQPPNSPDFNVLDLGFFRALQSERYHYVAKDLDDLITSVNLAWEKMPYTTLLKNFITLQSCMIESLKVGGSNFCKIPHMGKYKFLRKGVCPLLYTLTSRLSCCNTRFCNKSD